MLINGNSEHLRVVLLNLLAKSQFPYSINRNKFKCGFQSIQTAANYTLTEAKAECFRSLQGVVEIPLIFFLKTCRQLPVSNCEDCWNFYLIKTDLWIDFPVNLFRQAQSSTFTYYPLNWSRLCVLIAFCIA